MANRINVEIWICLDSDGEYSLGTTDEEALDNYRTTIGDTTGPVSLVQLIADCPLPRPIVGRLIVPDVPDQPVSVTFES